MSTGLHDFVTNLLQFGTGTDHVSLAEKIVRPIVVYLLLVVTLKLIGRRVLAQFSAFDFVVLLLISNTVQNAIIGNDTSLSGGLIGGITLLLFNALLVRILWRGPNRPLKGEGAEVSLWQFGEQVDSALNQFRVTVPELQIKAHERGFDSLTEVNEIRMAPNGSLIFTGQEADSGGSRHRELLERLDALQREIAQLGRRL